MHEIEALHDRVWALVKAKKQALGSVSHRKAGAFIKVGESGKPSDWVRAHQVDGRWEAVPAGAPKKRGGKKKAEAAPAPAPPPPPPEPPKPATVKARHMGLGVKFGGNCAVCGRHTGNREFEKAATALYKTEHGKFVVVHPACAGGKTKHAVGGGIKYRDSPDSTIDIDPD